MLPTTQVFSQHQQQQSESENYTLIHFIEQRPSGRGEKKNLCHSLQWSPAIAIRVEPALKANNHRCKVKYLLIALCSCLLICSRLIAIFFTYTRTWNRYFCSHHSMMLHMISNLSSCMLSIVCIDISIDIVFLLFRTSRFIRENC